eukprot:565046-Pyramimonas_sp.AAC.1
MERAGGRKKTKYTRAHGAPRSQRARKRRRKEEEYEQQQQLGKVGGGGGEWNCLNTQDARRARGLVACVLSKPPHGH